MGQLMARRGAVLFRADASHASRAHRHERLLPHWPEAGSGRSQLAAVIAPAPVQAERTAVRGRPALLAEIVRRRQVPLHQAEPYRSHLQTNVRQRATLTLVADSLWWDSEDALHIRTRSARYPGAVDLEPAWTLEAATNPDIFSASLIRRAAPVTPG